MDRAIMQANRVQHRHPPNQEDAMITGLFTPTHIALAVAGMCLSSWTLAQTAEPDAKQKEVEAGRLTTIIVTAERRVENIQKVPNSVSSIRGEMLDVLNSGGEDMRQISGRVPSLNIESSFGRAFPRFYIRGLGNTDFDLNASQPVQLLMDDIVQENPVLKGFPMFDLASVEVLRGPQGTLFGRNSPAGVVRVETVRPSSRFEGYGALTLGQYKSINAEGAVNMPLGKDTAARVSLQSQNRDDWVKNTRSTAPTQELEGYNDNAARLQLAHNFGGGLTVLANAHHRKLNGTARVFRANIIAPGTNNLVAGFDPARVSHDGINEQKIENNGASFRLNWNFGQMALTSITGVETIRMFSRGDIDGGFGAVFLGPGNFGPGFIPFDAESADALPKHRQVTQELRLQSTSKGPTNWLLGAFYFDETLDIESLNYSSIGGNTRNGFATQRQDTKAVALFGNVTFDVSPQLKLRGGVRWTKDEKDYVADRLQAPPFSPTFIGRRTVNTSDSNTSFDVAGTYELDKDVNLYARFATGFRAPSIQGRLLFGDTPSVADSETVRSFEAGVKADLLDRRARIAANVFSYEIKDQQFTAVGGAANFNQLVNAAKGVGRGFELDGQFAASANLLLTFNASLNKTRIKDPNLRVDACGSGCTATDPVIIPADPANGRFAPNVAINGNPFPQSPEVVVNVNARYSFPLAGGDAFVMTDWRYRSKVNFFLYEAVEFTGKSLTEGGLRAGYSWGGGKYEAVAFVRNVTNQRRIVGGIDFNNLTGFINEPRVFGATFKASF
jgi:iron complex outermembrane recepter protein